jgi:hypothetical protein
MLVATNPDRRPGRGARNCGAGPPWATGAATFSNWPAITVSNSAVDALFGRPSYGEPDAVSNPIGYAKFRSRSHNAVIRVYDEAGKVIETHEHKGDFREP